MLVSPRRPRRGGRSDKTVAEIDRLARKREERRKSAEEFKSKREAEIRDNEKKGKPGDVDFQRMIQLFRRGELPPASQHRDSGGLRVNVVVRKRPVSTREVRIKDYDSASKRSYARHTRRRMGQRCHGRACLAQRERERERPKEPPVCGGAC